MKNLAFILILLVSITGTHAANASWLTKARSLACAATVCASILSTSGCFMPFARKTNYKIEDIYGDKTLPDHDRLWAKKKIVDRLEASVEHNLEYLEDSIESGQYRGQEKVLERTKDAIARLDELVQTNVLPGNPNPSEEAFVYKSWPTLRYVYGVPTEDDLSLGGVKIRVGLTAVAFGAPYTVSEFLGSVAVDLGPAGWDHVTPYGSSDQMRVLAWARRLQRIRQAIQVVESGAAADIANFELKFTYTTDLGESFEDYLTLAQRGIPPGRLFAADGESSGVSQIFENPSERTYLELLKRVEKEMRSFGGIPSAAEVTILEPRVKGDAPATVDVVVSLKLYAPLFSQESKEAVEAGLNKLIRSQSQGKRTFSKGQLGQLGAILAEISAVESDEGVERRLGTTIEKK